MALVATPSQTLGPFFSIGLRHLVRTDFVGPDAPGVRLSIEGRVLDGDGKPVDDALLEIWQANAQGEYARPADPHERSRAPGFRGFGRVATDDDGRFRFATIKPGRVPGPAGARQAPHLAVLVGMRGLLRHLLTRLYFPDAPSNAEDPVLQLVPPERRGTLIAKPLGADRLEWNVILQGHDETVFFDY